MTMIFSLAIIQGISQKNVQQQDMNLQQIGAGCAYASGETEGGVSASLAYLGAGCLTASGIMLNAGLTTPAGLTPTPVSLGYWIGTGVIFL